MISETEVGDWIAAYGNAWVTQDPAKIVKLFTDNATYQERRFNAPLHGVESIRSYWQDLVQDQQRDIHFEALQIAITGEQAFVHWTAHLTWLPINGILELDAIARISFSPETRDGLRLATAFEEWIDSREG